MCAYMPILPERAALDEDQTPDGSAKLMDAGLPIYSARLTSLKLIVNQYRTFRWLLTGPPEKVS